MPQYYSPKIGTYHILVKPKNWFHHLWPYFVGEKANIRSDFKNAESVVDGSTFHLFEIFNGEVRSHHKYGVQAVSNAYITILGNPIEREGDIAYRLGLSDDMKADATIMSAHVVNTDRWLGIAVTAILTFIVTTAAGIALGVLDIGKFLYISP